MVQSITPTEDYLTYLKNKLKKCLDRHKPEACEKIKKQVELLEDSLVIYHLTTPPRVSKKLF